MADHTINKESELFLARAEDMAEQCRERGRPTFLGFLDSAQQTLVANKLKYSGLTVSFWGGYEDAERVFLGLALTPELDPSAFPITCLEFRWRQEEELSHRDFLGSFMSLQLRRETVGDICVEPGRAVAFLTGHAADLILAETDKIGRVGVSITGLTLGAAMPEKHFMEILGTVASLRLDCVAAFLSNSSRSSAVKLISSGFVALNGIAVTSPDKTISQGDKLSIRGMGKFIFDGQDGISRKEKLRLKFRKYQ